LMAASRCSIPERTVADLSRICATILVGAKLRVPASISLISRIPRSVRSLVSRFFPLVVRVLPTNLFFLR
jgi:hypothetical protein